MNDSTTLPNIIAKRYKILARIGEGGMGAVYRAHDRLTGQTVALKRVTAASPLMLMGNHTLTGGTIDLRVALAQEFTTLASLRHPHIISVLDYGFDHETTMDVEANQPYFTMELLENALPLLDAAGQQPHTQKLDLMIQILQSLAYLHRRGIIHRDLKPSNVLVADRTAKVVDFGLAVTRDVIHGGPNVDKVVGTLAYMAPEVLQGVPPDESSDLYAVGVMAYELMHGSHPFDLANFSHFLEDLLTREADVSHLPVDDALKTIIQRLLAKDRTQRFHSAQQVIDALASSQASINIESEGNRESFLQAARFVGRDAEINTLTVALMQAHSGRGSAWLIGGESGVGKTRLMDELRIQAMVENMLVLRGQSVTSSGLPYKLWRDSLRRLVLAVPIDDLEAAILQTLIPDLDRLLDRDIPPVQSMEGLAEQRRLINTIIDVFRRLDKPTLLLLDDLHWSAESLEPLKALNNIIAELPLLVIGSYRDDDRPHLPKELQGMQLMKLGRLSPTSIAALSESMLGDAGKDQNVIDLLQRETEGNTYFIVEVVRALVEDAGHITQIGTRTLPSGVVTGGVQAVIRRRLDRVKLMDRHLLRLAAITGRRLDLEILQHALDALPANKQPQPPTLESWLTRCADAAVIEIYDEQWQFAHDKLREATIADIDPADRPGLQRKVAEAMEKAHNDTTHAGALAEHWHAAADVDKAIHYAAIAGESALVVGAFSDGKNLLERVLEPALSQDQIDPRYMPVLRLMGALHWRMSDYDNSALYYAQTLAVANETDDLAAIAEALNGLAFVDCLRENYDLALERGTDALAYALRANDTINRARAHNNLGIIAESKADYITAAQYYSEALNIFRELNDGRGMASVLNNLGSIADTQGKYTLAGEYYLQSITICRQIGYKHGIATLLNNIGILDERLGNFTSALRNYRESLAIAQNIGDRRGCAHCYANMIFAALEVGEIEAARHYTNEAIIITNDLSINYIIPHVLAGTAWLRLLDNDLTAGAELLGALATEQDADFISLRWQPLHQRYTTIMTPSALTDAMARGKDDNLIHILRHLAADPA